MNVEFIKIGCDPELFCFNVATGKPVSVHDLIPGDKLDPYDVPLGAIQVDGTAAEFNIKPAHTRSDFIRNVKRVRGILENAVKAKNDNYILKAVPTVHYDPDYFSRLPMYAKMLGCEPDFDAYTGKPNPKPDAGLTMRTGSGHVHIQFLPDDQFVDNPLEDKDHFARCCDLVKSLDTTLYEASLTWDSDTERQKLYGKPGAFRPKKYGLEYRVLSNAWLEQDWTMQYVFDAAFNTTRKWLKGFSIYEETIKSAATNYKKQLDLQDANGIPSIRCYAPEGVIQHVAA